MNTWQKILREEIFHSDFELDSDNDKYIVDGVMSSYKEKLTANPEQVKEILDGAYQAGFKLEKRRYTSKTVFVLTKPHRNAYLVFQFSIQKDTLMACDVSYGSVDPKAKKSKYFPTIYNMFDKTLPLYFMETDILKENLQDDYHIQIKDEYQWSDYFDYVYSFMIYMLEQLNDEDSEVYLEETLNEEIKEKSIHEIFLEQIKDFNNNIRTELTENKAKKEVVLYIEWIDDFVDQTDEVKKTLNTIINEFIESFDKTSTEIEINRARTNLRFVRTIFIKYL